MTEAAKVRDWLSELRGAAEDDNGDLFRSLVAMIATAQPDLKEPVCQLAGEYLENGETWAADFFKERKRVEPKRAEPPPKSEAVKVIGPAPYRRDRKPKPEALFISPALQPSVEPPPTTPIPRSEPEPAPTPEPKEEEEVRVMLPAVVPQAKPQAKPPADWDDAIEAMNNRHAIIDNVGGKTVIAGWEPSPLDPAKLVVVFQNKESFLLRYSNRYATVDVADGKGGSQQRLVPLGNWWLVHRQRRQHRGITFLPDGPKVVSQCLNLWQGWGVEPKAGDWTLIREHIKRVLADGNEEFAD
jgi:hypothetical protein